MTRAGELLRDVHSALEATEAKIRRHPYLAAVKAGSVSLEALRAIPGHQYHMWQSDLRSAAHLVARFGTRPYGSFFFGDLDAEVAARGGITAMAAKLGMSEADLQSYEPSPQGFAYAAYFAWLALYGSAAEVACGLTVNLSAWGHNCAEVSKALRANYGFSAEETAFLDGFAALPSFDEIATEIIADDLARGVAPAEIMRAARLIQAYEAMFWDAMASAAA